MSGEGRYTNARFAQSAARIASMSSGWAASIIDSDDLQDSASPRAVRRYLAEMRERLDIIEKWEAENRSTEEPGP